MAKPLRIGVIGAADIAKQFVKAVAGSSLVTVAGVASRAPAKADAFARDHGIPRAFGSYEAMLADKDIDAVYNPLPNSLHAPWSIRACDAGKHVLCEKPLATCEQEARSMFEAARRNRVLLYEGYPYLAQPMTRDVRQLVTDGAIGRPQLIRATFGVPFSDPTNIRMIADLAGGAVMDAGSYAVSFVRIMAGERPSRVTAAAQYAETGVDKTAVATLEFASGLIAQVSASFATGYHRHGHVMGDKGYIETMYLNHPPLGGAKSYQIRRGTTAVTPIETVPVPEGNGFLLEAESFARAVNEGAQHWTGASETESVDIAAALAAILESARTKRPVDL